MNEAQKQVEMDKRETATMHNITRQQYDFVYGHLFIGNCKEDLVDLLILNMHERDIKDIVALADVDQS